MTLMTGTATITTHARSANAPDTGPGRYSTHGYKSLHRRVQAGDVATVLCTDGTRYVALPVLEIRAGGYRFGVRAGFAAQDLFVSFRHVAEIWPL